MLLLTNIANAQVQNGVNLLPDTGNVGIGTANPTEKLQVNGNSKLDGSVSVTDSLSVGSTLSVGSSLVVQDSLTVGTKMVVNQTLSVADSMSVGKSLSVRDSVVVGSNIRTEKNLYVADTLKVGGILEVDSISGVKSIISDKISTGLLSGPNGEIILADPLNPDPECTNLKINFCERRIFGYVKLASGAEKYYGVGIGVNAKTANEYSFAAGNGPWAAAHSSIALGYHTRALGEKSIVIGSSPSETIYFNNSIDNSLMIGFNTPDSKPSFFVGPSTIPGIPGNVGICTKTPSDKLVIGEGYEQISFGSAVNQDAGWLISYMGMNATRTRANTWQSSVWTISGDASSGYGGGIIATDAGGKMFIIPVATGANTTTTLTDAEIYARRVVEIGARSSTSGTLGAGLMRVNGNIICQDLEVTLTNWWDDVFSPGYSLMTISELQKYIDENGHLPGVPAESEVVGQTMSVQDMNLMLLKKVEELSLYVIDLQKQIDEIKNL